MPGGGWTQRPARRMIPIAWTALMAQPPTLRDQEESQSHAPGLGSWAAEYGPALRRYFEKRASAAEAEDLVQDVFLALQNRGQVESIDNVRGYLFTVAANVLKRRDLNYPSSARLQRALAPGAEALDEITPERVVLGREALERVIVAIEGLPPRVSEAFLLHRFEERTYEAVGRRMGMSTKRVEKLIRQALKRIQLVAERRP